MAIMRDGFPTRFQGASLTVVGTTLKVKSLTPPDIMGGGPNDITDMHTTVWRGKVPKKLKSMGTMTAVCFYDPAVYSTIVAQLQVNQIITVKFPGQAPSAAVGVDPEFEGQLEFWGWLDSFKPNEHVEGQPPTCTITVECSNRNNSDVEVAPVYSAL